MDLGQYITDDDVWELEQFDNWQENYLFWSKKFILDKINQLSTRFLEDADIYESTIESIENARSIDLLKDLVNNLSKIKVKGAKSYFIAIYKFYHFLEKVGAKNLRQIENKVVKAFIVSLKDEVGDETRNNMMVRVKNFLKYINIHNVLKNGEDSHDFRITISAKDVLKYTDKKIDIISPEKEYAEFLSGIEEITFKKDSERNKVFLKIALFTGMRVSEITYLKYKDIEISGGNFVFNIIGKGNKKRTLYIKKKELITLWNEYLKIRPIKSMDDYAFANTKGQPLADRTVSNYVRKILELKKINTTKKGLHIIRHSLSTKLLYSGEHTIEDISALLGHEDIATTQIYTHITNEHIKKTSKGISEVMGRDIKKIKRQQK